MKITANTERLVRLLIASYDHDPRIVGTARLRNLAAIGESPEASPLEAEQAALVRELIAIPVDERHAALRALLPF